MFITKVLTFAALAVLPALAAPSDGLAAVSDASLLARNGHQGCRKGEWWDGWKNQCKCQKKGCSYDDEVGRCDWPKKDHPQCGHNQKAYCARSQDDYCEYDKKDDRCRNDGKSKVFCCEKGRLRDELKKQCPKPPSCPSGQTYNWDNHSCQCGPREVYRNGKCCYPPLPQPNCRKGETGWCGKDKNNYVKYNQDHDYCQDDGNNVCFCDKNPKDYCGKHWQD